MHKKIGILGGLSPESTVTYYLRGGSFRGFPYEFFDLVYGEDGVTIMSNLEDWKFREILENWAQCIESHQRYIFQETARFVEVLKQRKLSGKTKNEIAIVIKGLQATVKSISKVIGKYIE